MKIIFDFSPHQAKAALPARLNRLSILKDITFYNSNFLIFNFKIDNINSYIVSVNMIHIYENNKWVQKSPTPQTIFVISPGAGTARNRTAYQILERNLMLYT